MSHKFFALKTICVKISSSIFHFSFRNLFIVLKSGLLFQEIYIKARSDLSLFASFLLENVPFIYQ